MRKQKRPKHNVLIIYNKNNEIIKQIDISNLPWSVVKLRAQNCMSNLLNSDHWDTKFIDNENNKQ